MSTSIRLENFIWDTLAGMAKDEGMTTNALIVTFHDEILQSRGDVQNFTSFLRVTCLRYLDRKCGQLAERLLQTQTHAAAQPQLQCQPPCQPQLRARARSESTFGVLGEEGRAPRSSRLN